jgi:hypothetical protein
MKTKYNTPYITKLTVGFFCGVLSLLLAGSGRAQTLQYWDIDGYWNLQYTLDDVTSNWPFQVTSESFSMSSNTATFTALDSVDSLFTGSVSGSSIQWSDPNGGWGGLSFAGTISGDGTTSGGVTSPVWNGFYSTISGQAELLSVPEPSSSALGLMAIGILFCLRPRALRA